MRRVFVSLVAVFLAATGCSAQCSVDVQSRVLDNGAVISTSTAATGTVAADSSDPLFLPAPSQPSRSSLVNGIDDAVLILLLTAGS